MTANIEYYWNARALAPCFLARHVYETIETHRAGYAITTGLDKMINNLRKMEHTVIPKEVDDVIT